MGIIKLLYCYIAILSLNFLVGCGLPDFGGRMSEVGDDMTAEITIGNTVIRAEVVRDEESQKRGLSGRDFLDEGGGMLFVFDDAKIRSFWMKGMKFDLDIIFINDTKNAKDAELRKCENDLCYAVVDLVEGLPAPVTGKEPMSYTSKQPANYVLEVKAGFVDAQGIEVGDEVDILW